MSVISSVISSVLLSVLGLVSACLFDTFSLLFFVLVFLYACVHEAPKSYSICYAK